jgi:hypothetical protein
MTVFVALLESMTGGEIIGAFSSPHKAEGACERDAADEHVVHWTRSLDGASIAEVSGIRAYRVIPCALDKSLGLN